MSMFDTSLLFSGGPAPLMQGLVIAKQDRQQAFENQLRQQQAEMSLQQEARLQSQEGRQQAEYERTIADLDRQRVLSEIGITARQVSSLIGSSRPQEAKQVLMQAMSAAQSNPALIGLVDDLQMMTERIDADPAGVKAIADSVISSQTQQLNSGIRASQILDDGTVIQSTDTGTRVIDPQGRIVTGEDAAQAIRRGQDYGIQVQQGRAAGRTAGTLSAEGELKPGVEAKVTTATEQAKLSADSVRSSYEMIPKVSKSIANIDSAIDALEKGAGTGAISQYLPSITDASIALENSMSLMGLDVISTTTFGALSEGEMRMALQSALPTGLSESALKTYLLDKRAAQEKALEALRNAVTFLSKSNPDGTPRTVSDYLGSQQTEIIPVTGAGKTAAQPATTGADAFVRQRQGGSTETYEERKRRLLGR